MTRLGTVVALSGALLYAGSATASAHVHVLADSTTSGSFAALTFRVPNESATASTKQLTVALPQDKPFLSVSIKPVPGWRATTTMAALPQPVQSEGTTITKAVRTVTWAAAAAGSQIQPGQYQEFSLSVGPLPTPGTVLLPAVQTYTDGSVVRWNQPTPATGEEPEHPAPAIEVTAATPAAAPDTPSAQAPPAPAATSVARSDATARTLSVVALALGLVSLAVAAMGLRRRPVRP